MTAIEVVYGDHRIDLDDLLNVLEDDNMTIMSWHDDEVRSGYRYAATTPRTAVLEVIRNLLES